MTGRVVYSGAFSRKVQIRMIGQKSAMEGLQKKHQKSEGVPP